MSSQIPFGDSIVRADITNISVLANSDIISPVSPRTAPLAWFVIYAVFQLAGRLKITRLKGAAINPSTEILNEDVDLKSNTAYMFIFPVMADEIINVQYSQSTTATKLTLLEIVRMPS